MNFTDAHSFASMVVEHSGVLAESLDTLPWLDRMDTLYQFMCDQKRQGLPACYPRTALLLWGIVGTDEHLTPEVGAAMREMSFAALCEVVYELSQCKAEQFVPWLNERVLLVA